MQNLNQVQQDFLSKINGYENIHTDLEGKLNALTERKIKLEKKILKISKTKCDIKYPHWTENLLKPVLNIIKEQTPQLTWDFVEEKQLNVFGLRCDCPVFAHFEGETVVYLNFTCNIKEGILYFDNGKTKNNKKDFDIHGFNNEREELKNIEQLLEFVNKQFLENTTDCFYYQHNRFKPYKNLNEVENPLFEKIIDLENFNYDEFCAAAKKKNIKLTHFLIMNDGKYVFHDSKDKCLISYWL
jgi:uncharacterized protein YfbU (UPF0304 family)